MEIHHHAHSPAHDGSPRKKWTHYFWEFMMLFLAVFCGFLAEYQLEHKIEKEKGRQYIRSFYRDLVTDTSAFTELITRFELKMAVLRTRPACYDTLTKDLRSEDCFWNLFYHSTFFPDLIYTDRTLQQLKNAGGLRLLKPEDADSILQYDNLVKTYKAAEASVLQESQSGIRTSMYNLVDQRKINGDSTVSFLYENNRAELNKFFNQLYAYSTICEGRINELKYLRNRVIILIGYFKSKYKLK